MKNKTVKFKFINREFDHETETDFNSFKMVENPIGYHNLPNGEYMIRGDKAHQRKNYYHAFNSWYLVETVLKDNGHFYCDSETYSLYPNLSEKEWKKLNSINTKYLSKHWRRCLYGYNFHMELRKLIRDINKDFIKYKQL